MARDASASRRARRPSRHVRCRSRDRCADCALGAMTDRPTRRPRPDRRPHRHDGRRPPLGERAGRARRADRGGRDRRGGRGRTSGRSTRVIDLRGRTVTPGLPGRPRPPGPRRAGDAALRPARGCAVRPGYDRIEAYAAVPSGRALDPRRRLVHGRLRGRDAAPRGPRPDRPGSAGLPDQPRRPRRVGQHAGRSSSPG